MSNLQEFESGTDPTNSASGMRITSVTRQGADVQVTWTTVGGMGYVVQNAATIAGGLTNNFLDISPLISMPGNGESTTNYLDADALTNRPNSSYRIRLGP